MVNLTSVSSSFARGILFERRAMLSPSRRIPHFEGEFLKKSLSVNVFFPKGFVRLMVVG